MGYSALLARTIWSCSDMPSSVNLRHPADYT
jgi:hypothetical protein